MQVGQKMLYELDDCGVDFVCSLFPRECTSLARVAIRSVARGLLSTMAIRPVVSLLLLLYFSLPVDLNYRNLLSNGCSLALGMYKGKDVMIFQNNDTLLELAATGSME
jgi:hypothetical protein